MGLSLDSPLRRPKIGIDIALLTRADFEHEAHIILRRFVKRRAPLGGAGKYGEEKDEWQSQ